MNPTLVCDIDQTISVWNDNRDYINFEPIQPMIDKLNEHFNLGYDIILHTARGMDSMDGDIDRIEDELRDVLEQWLENNQVLYTKLIFGKPAGLWYIDDKAMTPEEFLETF